MEKTHKNSDVFGRNRDHMQVEDTIEQWPSVGTNILLWSMQWTLGDDVLTYVKEPTVARPQVRRPTATARWPNVNAGQRTMGPVEHG